MWFRSNGRGLRRYPGLEAIALVLALMAGCGAEYPEPTAESPSTEATPAYPMAGPPQIFFISIDTLRADMTSPYGSAVDTTPFLKSLADESVVYTRAYAPMPTTKPSHLTMLTGLYPQEHGAMSNGVMPHPDLLGFPELMKRQGRKTAAFTSAWHLSHRATHLPGFDVWDAAEEHDRDAKDTVDLALAHLESIRNEPFFFWLHVFDPHSPYRAHEDSGGELLKQVEAYAHVPDSGAEGFVDAELTEDQVGKLKALYRADVGHMDAQLKRFFEALKGYGFDRTALILIAADHGELMDELLDTEGYGFDHGKMLAHEELRIPLIVRPPGGRAGARVDQVVENRAVFGTLVEAAGLEAWVDAPSELPLPESAMASGSDESTAFVIRRVFLSEELEPALEGTRLAVIRGKWMVRRTENSAGRRIELFDVEADPHGVADLAPQFPEESSRLDGLITQWQAGLELSGGDEAPTEVDEDIQKSLESLGYLR